MAAGWRQIGRMGRRRRMGLRLTSPPFLPFLPLLLPRALPARDRLQPQAAGRPRTTRRRSRPTARRRTPSFAAGDDPIPTARSTPSSCRSPTFRSIPTTTCRRRSSRSTIRRSSRCRRRPARTDKMRRVGTLGVHAEGPAAEADGVRRAREHQNLDRLFVAVQRSHERHRNLRGRPLPGSRPQRHRHLQRRLQPRLHSVLLLQPDLRVSAIRRARIA